MKRQHFFLKELPGTLPEDIVVRREDPPGADVSQTLSRRRLQALRAMLLGWSRAEKEKQTSAWTQAQPISQPFEKEGNTYLANVDYL